MANEQAGGEGSCKTGDDELEGAARETDKDMDDLFGSDDADDGAARTGKSDSWYRTSGNPRERKKQKQRKMMGGDQTNELAENFYLLVKTAEQKEKSPQEVQNCQEGNEYLVHGGENAYNTKFADFPKD